jgi:hypothetical protein
LSSFQELFVTNEILIRTDTSIKYLLIAVLLGFATILASIKGIPESIAGVAIAAALLPPAAAAGILVVVAPRLVGEALYLVSYNVLGHTPLSCRTEARQGARGSQARSGAHAGCADGIIRASRRSRNLCVMNNIS